MRNYIVILMSTLLFSGCTYSQNMVNPEGHTILCSSYGWGFIGAPMAMNILNECIKSHRQLGYVEVEKVGVPGFYLAEGNPPGILKVQPGGPAAKAGMLPGDKIVAVNGQKVTSMREVYVLGFCKPGEMVEYQVKRGDEIKNFTIITIPKATKLE